MLWEELRVGQFADALERSEGMCVIPIGATEKHGQHLPLGTDNYIAEHIAIAAAEKTDVMVFPTFHFGELLGFQQHPGSVCLSIDLIIQYLTEVCAEIGRNGFKKILLFSCHGGNESIMQVIAQKTQESKKDYVVLSSKCYNPEPREILDYIKEKGRAAFPFITDEDVANLESFCSAPRVVGHACFGETLALVGCRPDTADLSLMDAEDGLSTHRLDHLRKLPLYSPYFWAASYPNHYQGTYHPGANENLAKVSYEVYVNKVAHIFKTIKEDKELLACNEEWNKKW